MNKYLFKISNKHQIVWCLLLLIFCLSCQSNLTSQTSIPIFKNDSILLTAALDVNIPILKKSNKNSLLFISKNHEEIIELNFETNESKLMATLNSNFDDFNFILYNDTSSNKVKVTPFAIEFLELKRSISPPKGFRFSKKNIRNKENR